MTLRMADRDVLDIEGSLLMANGGDNRMFGIGLGGVLVIAGVLLAIFWSVWIGIIVALVGLIAFGGFAKGRWY